MKFNLLAKKKKDDKLVYGGGVRNALLPSTMISLPELC